jgi:hypothetical protein
VEQAREHAHAVVHERLRILEVAVLPLRRALHPLEPRAFRPFAEGTPAQHGAHQGEQDEQTEQDERAATENPAPRRTHGTFLALGSRA